MPRAIHRLNTVAVQAKKDSGYYADGGGLYLQVSRFGTKSWVFRYTLNKKREMGLGPIQEVSLKQAREAAAQCRALVREGIDPIADRQERKGRSKLEAARLITFKTCAEDYIRTNSAAWSNIKHAAQWASTLETYAYPTLGPLPVSMIETHHIVDVLTPIWPTKNETARRVRGRIEAVLDAAKVKGLRTGENPARWRGHLDKLLPKPSKVAAVTHHASLPYAQMGDLMRALRAKAGIAPMALEFLILTAARTNEVIGATFDELDLNKAVWTIPADRMKAKREHRVPLSGRALEIARTMEGLRQSNYIFPGHRSGKGLSNMAFLQLLKRMDWSHVTVHGFRSTFRDWAAEQTAYPADVVEMALAHSVGTQVQQAYLRTDLFEKRASLMRDWADYLEGLTS